MKVYLNWFSISEKKEEGLRMADSTNQTTKPVLSSALEKFKYEVAQEIGIANRKHKKFPNT